MAKNKKKAIKESKHLKEGYIGQTLQDFLDLCVDADFINKIYVYGTDNIVYEGSMDELPYDMRDASFMEFDAYSNGRDIVTVNVDSSLEYGYDAFYEFLGDFLDDCNNENVVIFDLDQGEEIYRGDRESVPDEIRDMAFASFDTPDELSVNLSDYEGDSDAYDDDEEDEEFDEALGKVQEITRAVDSEGNEYHVKPIWKTDRLATLVDKDGKETKVELADIRQFYDLYDQDDEVISRYEDYLDEALKENEQPFYRVVKDPKGKGYCILKRVNKLDKSNTFINDHSKEVFNTPEEAKAMLDKVDELHFYIDENLKEAKDKKYFYELTDIEKKEVLSVLANIVEFAKGDQEISTHLHKYGSQSGSTEISPISIWNESGEVRIMLDPETNDATARKIINKIKKQFDTKSLWIYYDKNDGSYPPEIIIKYLNDGKNENLKESTIPVKDLLVKVDNKYGITLDHAIDDIKRSKGYNDSLLGDNYTIDLLMRRFGLEHRDVIRALNYKFDGKVLDESVEEDMEKLPHVVMAFKDGGVNRLELEWRPSTRKAHSDYVDLSQAIKNKFGDADIKVKKQEWRDGNKETRYVLEVTLKDNAIKEDVNQLAKKMGAKLLPPRGYGAKPKRPRYVYEVYYFDTPDCKGDAIYRKFSSRKAQEQWYEAHKNDTDKFGMYAFDDATIYENLDEAYNTEDRIKELKEIKKTRALTDDELEELAYCENEVSSREAEKNYLNGESLSNKLTEAPDDMGFETDDEIEAQERAEFEKRLAQRKANRDASKKQELDRQEQEKAKEQAKQDAIAKGKELYNKVKDLPFEEWFEYLVPSSGKAPTVAGEIVRAVNKLAYRWYNDGDEFYQGYGRETCGAPAVYLMYKIDEVAPKLNKLINCDEDSYSKGLDELKDIVHTYLLNNQDAFGTVNEEDSMDKEEFNIDVEFEEPRDCEWQIELRDYEKNGITLADYINNGNIDSWDFISRLQEDVSSELGGNSAFEIELPWSSYATDYKIYNLTKDEWDTVSYQLSKSDYFDSYLEELYNEYGDPTEAPIDDEEVEESINRNWDTLEFNYEKLPVSKFNPNTLERTPMEIDYTHKVKQEDVEDALFKILDDKGELDDYSLEGGVAYVMNNFDELVTKYEDELKELFRSGAINTAENSDLSEDLDTFDDQMDFLSKDEEEAIDGYKKVIKKVDNAKVKTQLKKIETEEKAHKDYLTKVKRNKDIEYTEPLDEDTVKQGNKWVNKGNTGETHGEFKTKKEADKQRKAMFVNKKPNAKWGK